jgi:hypothetical protein
MLANKQMRTGLFFYMMAMHLLVFGTTYHWSHSSSCDFVHSHPDLPLPEKRNNESVAANAAAVIESAGSSGSW